MKSIKTWEDIEISSEELERIRKKAKPPAYFLQQGTILTQAQIKADSMEEFLEKLSKVKVPINKVNVNIYAQISLIKENTQNDFNEKWKSQFIRLIELEKKSIFKKAKHIADKAKEVEELQKLAAAILAAEMKTTK